MLRASRREDRKRVPQYSSPYLSRGSEEPHGSDGADVRESFGKCSAVARPGTRWVSSPGPAALGGRRPLSREIRMDIAVSGTATRPTAWVGGSRKPDPRVPE